MFKTTKGEIERSHREYEGESNNTGIIKLPRESYARKMDIHSRVP